MAALREIQDEHDRWISTVGSEGRCADLSELLRRPAGQLTSNALIHTIPYFWAAVCQTSMSYQNH